jgi:thiol:disulfide interchange protein DsbA
MMEQSAVDRWPMIVVDGRWITSPSHAGAALGENATEAQSNQAVLPVMDYLVAKAKADKR